MVKLGGKAPEFCLKDQHGRKHCLKDYLKKKKIVVIYFYPKDDTPGCTIEGQQFSAMLSSYNRQNVQVLGISPDSIDSHKQFARKYKFKVTILSDPDKTVIKKYGVWGKKVFMGKSYEGVLRTTFVIDSYGRILFVFESVNPTGHATEVLKKIGKWKNECGMKELGMPLNPITPKPGD
ncbi:MAG TPA: thioredoxin-dependent thiol peroxidase [Candidatus Norongarragalinales archaeon]|nr:thioredoxin-dependent thiol peroxidase [Candidatus Norongarragalinales archaeon]